jgi:hypothetical protein
MWEYTAIFGRSAAKTRPTSSGEVWCARTGAKSGESCSAAGAAATSWMRTSTPSPYLTTFALYLVSPLMSTECPAWSTR